MESNLVQALRFVMQPVAVSFTDDKPDGARQFAAGKRSCMASALTAASKGEVYAVDEETCGCSGGGVGLCFGDTFTKRGHPTRYLLSTGSPNKEAAGANMSRHMREGERFFASPELVDKWKDNFPFQDAPERYVVFAPFALVEANEPPDLIVFFANPDQLSALVIMAGFNTGETINAIAPFGAACQSIVFAYGELKKEQPKAVMGYFDISQRNSIPRDLLSLTVPFSLFLEMEADVDKSCLTTLSWELIDGRWLDEA